MYESKGCAGMRKKKGKRKERREREVCRWILDGASRVLRLLGVLGWCQ